MSSTNLQPALISGTTDNWTIGLFQDLGGSPFPTPSIEWVEPAGSTGVNVLTFIGTGVVDGMSFHFFSFVSESASTGGTCGTGSPLPLGASCLLGVSLAPESIFVTVNEVVPEPPSIALIGAGIAGLAFVRRRHRLGVSLSSSRGCACPPG